MLQDMCCNVFSDVKYINCVFIVAGSVLNVLKSCQMKLKKHQSSETLKHKAPKMCWEAKRIFSNEKGRVSGTTEGHHNINSAVRSVVER